MLSVEMLVTNIESEARAFGERGEGGVVYAPLTSDDRYLIAGDDDWNGLAAMARVAPVALAQPHGASYLACVVGARVVWDGAPPVGAPAVEPRLLRFASAVGLSFLQVILADVRDDLRVVAVEPQPRLEQFGVSAQLEIAENLARLLTAESRDLNTVAVRHGVV